ncbi:MAG: hypothetical protein NC911_00315 [Candidatus Omnitrophica bacterium]|nr:hypothetical protein [Candidatus Omnitrophota bacterium]
MKSFLKDRKKIIFLASLWLILANAENSFDHYQIISERNIFLPQRKKPDKQQKFYSILKEAPPVNPAANIVLTGIVRHGQDYLAFFEDRLSRKTLRVRAGENLLGGKIQQITLDYVEYVAKETPVKVEIGKTLANSTPLTPAGPVSSPASPSFSSTLVSSGSDISPPSSDTSNIVEQMRRRRLQELGQP